MFDVLRRYIRHAMRALASSPGFTAIAILSLALGIGVNSAIFTLVNATTFPDLPYREADRLVDLHETSPELCAGCSVGTSFPTYRDWRQTAASFTSVGAYREAAVVVAAREEPERISGAYISASLFPTLGAHPVLGRAFASEEDRRAGARVALLGHGLWTRAFKPWLTVVGVVRNTVSNPLSTRLAPFVDVAFAQNPGNSLTNVKPLTEHLADWMTPARFMMRLLVGLAALALILAAIGIYGVLSYIVTQRIHEIGIRVALGAAARRIVQLVVRQGVAMAALGVLLGLLGAIASTRVLRALLFGASATDPWVLGGVAVMLLMIALVACVIPVRRALRVDPVDALRVE